MPIVACNTPFISQDCINDCILKLDAISEADPVLEIRAARFVREVNILVIAYFMLFKKQKERLKGFRILLNLQHNLKPYRILTEHTEMETSDTIDTVTEQRWKDIIGADFSLKQNNDLGRTLRQYMAYAFLQTEGTDPFTVQYGHVLNPNQSTNTDQIAPLNQAKRSWFQLSRKFTPILALDPKGFDVYFTHRIGSRADFQEIWGKLTSVTNAERNTELSGLLRQDLLPVSGNKDLAIIKLARLAFIRALDSAMILPNYLNKDKALENGLAVNRMSGPDSREYYQKVRQVFLELNEKPAIFHFLYATLLANQVRPDRLDKDRIETFSKTLRDLWAFVKELVYGVQELALNIIDHTETKRGVITCRIYNSADYRDLNPEITTLFQRYLTKIGEDEAVESAVPSPTRSFSFFDFQVADDGSSGVIRTLLKSTEAMANEDGMQKADIQTDVVKLGSGRFRLSHLLNPNQGLVLNQQAKRATAHFGLLTLAKLVERNSGLLRASTWRETAAERERQFFVALPGHHQEETRMITMGTNYHIVFPVNPAKKYASQFLTEELELPDGGKPLIEGIEKLFDYYPINESELPAPQIHSKDILVIQSRLNNGEDIPPEAEYWGSFALRSKSDTEKKAGQPFIVALDMEGTTFDHGKLFRFLGNWELEYTGHPLIIYNFPVEGYLQLLRLNYAYITSQNIPFWNKNSLCIFYNYTTDPDSGERFYYTDVLWGAHREEFVSINTLTSRVAFNSLTIDLESGASVSRTWLGDIDLKAYPQFSPQQLTRLQRFGLFDKKGVILPANLLVTSKNNSLFAANASLLLQNEIKTGPEDTAATAIGVSNYYSALQGYKIKGSHFRIGSKIHISDFYYAKRFFQNSFFSSPMAYLVASDILELLLDPPKEELLDDQPEITAITLVGYGQYSEMLLSLSTHFLAKAIAVKFPSKEIKLNFDLLSDTEGAHFLKNEEIYPHVVLVNPIASTFSTSIKMQEAVHRKNNEARILGPHINLLYIYDSGGKHLEMEATFGLTDRDLINKTIKLTIYAAITGAKSQPDANFYLALPAEWYNVADCRLCFPEKEDKLKEEKPLYITDKTLVTPTLIFGNPQGRETRKQKILYTIDPACLKYGHYVHNSVHYLFYIDIEHFFRINTQQVREWLRTSVKNNFKDYGPVTIVSPSHNSNTNFLNLINEVVFFNSATILHYEAEIDHIQNFRLFYQKELNNKEGRVIFVDDIITTGSTFIKTNYFLENTRASEKGFDAAIILMDRSDKYAHENFLSVFPAGDKPYFSFADIQLPSIKSTESECPLCLEQKRYEELAASSFLDRLKFHFLEQMAKVESNDNPFVPKKITARSSRTLTRNEVETIKAEALGPLDEQKYIRKIDAINRIYQWFADPGFEAKFESFDTFNDWKKHLLEHTACPFNGSDLRKGDITPKAGDQRYHACNASDTLLKVLTQSPFTNFKPIREKAFKWVLHYLIALTGDWQTPQKLEPEDFRVLKFLIRRAGQLNQNYLISAPFFRLLENVYHEDGIPRLIGRTRLELAAAEELVERETGKETTFFSLSQAKVQRLEIKERLTNLLNFNVFFAAQVKELLFLNEGRSIRLEQLLQDMVITDETPPLYIQLLRIIREENGILLYKFWDYFRDKYPLNEKGTQDYDIRSLGVRLTEDYVSQHNRGQSLKEFLSIAGNYELSGPDDHFQNYLWLMYYLAHEQDLTGPSLRDKTEFIMGKFQDLLFPGQKDCGSFLIVEYDQQNPDGYFIAYNNGIPGKMEEKHWRETDHKYVESFLNGNTDNTGQSAKTIIELHLNVDQWEDIYATNEEEKVVPLHPHLLPDDYDHLLLIRLNQRKIRNCPLDPTVIENLDHPLGVLGFYSKTGSRDKRIAITNNRYLLLLRDSLSEFVRKHHENNEFKDWMDADRMRRTALLTGHGRDILISVANHDFSGEPERSRPYKEIVATIQMIQSFIIDIDKEKTLLEYIICVFKKYFIPSTILEAKYFKPGIEQMINEVFYLNEVENEDSVLWEVNCPPNLDFKFPEKLLDMFLFELILNAKKNRWLLFEDETNTVKINVSPVDGLLKILISNTGPSIHEEEDGTLKKLNATGNTKKDNDASGIYLIKRIILLFDLGELKFLRGVPIDGDLHWFNVELTLKPWHVADKCFAD